MKFDQHENDNIVHQGERDLGDGKKRRYQVAVRPGFQEGQYLGMMLRCYGPGHWCEGTGQPSFCTKRDDAIAEGERWLDAGGKQQGSGQ